MVLDYLSVASQQH